MPTSLSLNDVATVLAGEGASWWVAGGWAIDHWLARATRPHDDLDIAILRKEQGIIRDRLAGWDLQLAHEGRLEPLSPANWVQSPFHAVWCRPAGSDVWAFELLINDSDDQEWVFRRDHRVRRPIEQIGGTTGEGVPYLRPEVVLLYKAKDPREQDEFDFDNAFPRLATPDREWLRASLQLVHPSHSWIERLPV